ncbi:7027_t:CDS:2 [Entrophospora sp. SA101]|nr:7027_t:CDS:2 [Entrophospora sp. SA101]
MKAILEEKYQDLKVSERTVHPWSREKKPVQPMIKHPLREGRYLYLTENLDRHLYCKILNEQLYDNADELMMIEDGKSIEPKWYVPIIPMVLVNGAEGIGEGWSTNIPNFNLKDIIQNLGQKLMAKNF